MGEVAGGDYAQDRFLDVPGRNLDAALDIGDIRPALQSVAKGLVHPNAYFAGFDPGNAEMGSHRNIGQRHLSILDDHDHVTGSKIRFSSEAASYQQGALAVAIQLFSFGIPCLYYGTEQSFAGPEESERRFLPGYKGAITSTAICAKRCSAPPPRRSGLPGLAQGATGEDAALPGFGPFGTAGAHCFTTDFPTYRRNEPELLGKVRTTRTRCGGRLAGLKHLCKRRGPGHRFPPSPLAPLLNLPLLPSHTSFPWPPHHPIVPSRSRTLKPT